MSMLAATGLTSFLRFLSLIFVFIVVLAVTYYVTRWVGNFQKERYTKGNIQIIEARQIGQNKFIYVAKIGNDYFALSSGKENFSVIGKIDEAGLTLPEESKESDTNKLHEPFLAVLQKVKNAKKPKE